MLFAKWPTWQRCWILPTKDKINWRMVCLRIRCQQPTNLSPSTWKWVESSSFTQILFLPTSSHPWILDPDTFSKMTKRGLLSAMNFPPNLQIHMQVCVVKFGCFGRPKEGDRSILCLQIVQQSHRWCIQPWHSSKVQRRHSSQRMAQQQVRWSNSAWSA